MIMLKKLHSFNRYIVFLGYKMEISRHIYGSCPKRRRDFLGISEFKRGLLNPKTFVNFPQYQEHDGQLSCLVGVLRVVFFLFFFGGWVGWGVYYVPWCFYLAIDCLLQQAEHFSAEQACEQEGGCLVSM